MNDRQKEEYLALYSRLPDIDQVKYGLILNRNEIISSETQFEKVLSGMRERVRKNNPDASR